MYREAFKMPTKWTLIFVQPAILVMIVLVIIMIAKPLSTTTRIIMIGIIVVEALITAGLIVLFTRFRVSIEGRTLMVGFPAFRERIPLEQITACAPITYRWIEWGGYGIRINRRDKMYNVPGDGGRAVQITLDNGRRIFFSSTDPAAACAAIDAARGGEGGVAGKAE
jgi:hypothetical protein